MENFIFYAVSLLWLVLSSNQKIIKDLTDFAVYGDLYIKGTLDSVYEFVFFKKHIEYFNIF